MRQRSVGIRELKSKLSRCIREVKKGATLVVTERGHPVARLVPERTSLEERLAALNDAGVILWSGRRLGKARPVARIRKDKTLADIVIENRE